MKNTYLILIFALLTACVSKNKPNDNSANAETKVVIDFFKWYKNNLEKINKINMVDNSDSSGDSTKFYKVNFNETEKYLAELKNSGFISDKYIEKWRKYFKKCDSDLKTNLQNEGPPSGFEYDFVTLTQEVNYVFAGIDNAVAKEKFNNGKSSIVEIIFGDYFKYKINLSKTDDKWKIDDIETINE